MDVIEAIKTRRSNGQVIADEPIDKDVIEELLEAGSWAPTHHRTDPWRFHVFMGEGRKRLATAMAEGAKTNLKELYPDNVEEKAQKLYHKAFRAPVIIAIWTAAGRGLHKNPPVWEDHAAVAAAAQNISLAAHAKGLGCIWRSGPAAQWPEVESELGLDTNKGDRIMGFLYIGHKNPDKNEPLRPTPKWQERTVWVITD